METGKIMRFEAERGFGFVRPDRGGPDLFLHISELPRDIDPHGIRQGLRVSFEEEDTGRGPKAVRVRLQEAVACAGAGMTPQPSPQPAPATVESWRALWDRVSDAAFDLLLAEARANGWVQT